ncbi:uncharacterized protein I303_107998 [Kwoniella dejecticola CBS 10117]|uniref:nicotinamidase n=1 Tax=Kwoniella dejecticola CBS 10117 TaxID=1296121 RepID=A0A1A5ZW85_9TREE|nr:uncharacterized protein I303_07989 [Kwoniella dejecticola CBS 10117]OBR82075.1 hypothetical protein I303_07989 [Kwoniella dejecticola CBS 10117]
MNKTALLIIDVQYDFLPPSGSLAVPDGESILPVIHDLLDRSKWDWPLIVASQDYHPKNHISFASNHSPHKPFDQLTLEDARGMRYEHTLWPNHCIQGTRGTEIEDRLVLDLMKLGDKVKLARKGTHEKLEAYSAFEGAAHPGETILPEQSPLSLYLRSKGIEKVVIVGLATDFCVLQTAVSAISASFDTMVLGPGIRGISPDDSEKALGKVRNLGGTALDQDHRDWTGELRRWIDPSTA